MHSFVDRRALLIAIDGLTAVGAVYAGVWARFGTNTPNIWLDLGLPPVWLLAASYAALALASFTVAGVYRREIYWDLRSELKDFAKGVILLGFVSLAFLFLFKLEDVSRIAIVSSFGILILVGATTRLLARWRARTQAAEGQVLSNWLIVGQGEELDQFTKMVNSHPHVGAGIVGFVADAAPAQYGARWLGTVYDLPEILRAHVIDEVIVSGVDDQKTLEAVLSVCAEQGKTVRLALSSVAPTALRGRLEEYDGIPMWSILSTPEYSFELATKRLVDIAGSAMSLLVLSPLLVATAIAVRVLDGSPILYKQRRSGLHGREFTMLKFRTMVNGAETARAGLTAMNERTGPAFKMSSDPRVTRLGRWLRRTSIDETAQLINVLLGQMSLVGPRPQPLEEVAHYALWHRKRLSMRPGITGLWQIRARHDPSFDTWMDNDLEYINRWSLWLDLWILVRTPRALIRTPGD